MNNLGNIIKNATARAVIYGAYVIAALVVGGVDVYFGDNDPSWVPNALALIAYLAIPVGGLAAVNSSLVPTKVIAPEAEVIYADTAFLEEDEVEDAAAEDKPNG